MRLSQKRRYVRRAAEITFLAAFLAGLTFGAESGRPAVSERGLVADPGRAVRLLALHFSSRADCWRAVVDLEGGARYKLGSLSKPERLYIDLFDARVSPELDNQQIVVGDAVVSRIRVARNRDSVIRVVFDLNQPARHTVTALTNPARLVVELRPVSPEASLEASAGQAEGAPTNGSQQQEKSQSTEADQASSQRGPEPFGSGQTGSLSYSGGSSPRNFLLVDVDAQSVYDDNVLSNNAERIGAAGFSISPRLSFRRQGKHLTFNLGYQPNLLIYQKEASRNSLDQNLRFDGDYQFTPRFDVRTHGSLLYRTGVFQPQSSEAFLPGLAPPTSLNQTVISPLTHQFEHDFGFDATYLTSFRTSFRLFGDSLQRDFSQPASQTTTLLNTNEKNAGLEYRYRLGPTSTFGALYLLQDFRFGTGRRLLSHSAFFSYTRQVSPALSVDFFGGPDYTRLHDLVILPLGIFTLHIPIFRARWHWSAGGNLTKQSDKTVYQISAQRQITDAGGFFAAAINTYVGASVRRKLSSRWDSTWSLGYTRTSDLNSTALASNIQGETASFGLDRLLTEKLTARFGYQFNRQRSRGSFRSLADFDRDFVYFGVSYHIGRIPIGR